MFRIQVGRHRSRRKSMINILLFSYLQEAIGKSTLQADLANQTVSQVKAWMEAQYP